MAVRTGDLTIETQGNNDVIDLTQAAASWVRATGESCGTLVVFAPHTTVGITALEFEAGANRDLGEICERLVPAHAHYHHNVADTNGHAHARAALLGPAIHVPVVDSKLVLGTWQSIALIDFDDRPRTRRVVFQLTS